VSPNKTAIGENSDNRLVVHPKKKKAKAAPEVEVKPTHVYSDCGTRVWELIRSVGKGGCGEVYMSQEIHGSKEIVAIKLIKERKQFVNELSVMRALNNHVCGRGNIEITFGFTPKLITSCKRQKAIVMEYLSESLSQKFENFNHHFSLKTILMLALNIVIKS
jgi:serine/threonine protein kinase